MELLKQSDIDKWRKTLKQEASNKGITLTMYKENIAYEKIKDIFDTLARGDTIDKNEFISLLPYNIMLISKYKRNALKLLPNNVKLIDFIKLYKCIKSPQDYVNLYLFELLGYPKDKYNMFKLGKVYKYTPENGQKINIKLPTNILKGALKLYYDLYAIRNHEFLSQCKELHYDIESKEEHIRCDLVFRIATGKDAGLKYVKEYYEEYHNKNDDRILADSYEKSYLKLNGTALTIFRFGEEFYKNGISNQIDINKTIEMLTNAVMYLPYMRYKYILKLFEKDLNYRVQTIEQQLSKMNNMNKTNIELILNEKRDILAEFVSNKSIRMLFDIKEMCYKTDNTKSIEYNQLVELFKIDKKLSEEIDIFKTYLIDLGFSLDPENDNYAWYQISEMISKYKNNKNYSSY